MNVADKLRARLAELDAESKQLIADAEAREGDDQGMTAEEFDTIKRNNEEAADIEARLAVVEEQERRGKVAADAAAKLPATGERKANDTHVDGEPRVYPKGGRESYFLDLARAETGAGDAASARDRLSRHARQSDDELSKRDAAVPGFEKRTNPNRTDGTGGYFVPPVWLVDQYVALFRAGRVTADLVRNIDLPSGTDSINIPKVNTGTSAAVQTADAAAVSSTDLTDTSVSAGVKTIAGQQDIALQLLEQSPIAFDEVIYADLVRAYNVALDAQVLNGSNASGQAKGILQVSSPTAVTYTDASPTGPEFFQAAAQTLSQVSYSATGTFDLSNIVWVMHPRRWFWLVASLDSQNRPLVVPNGPGFNALATVDGAPAATGVVGTMHGVPVAIDANVPTTLGAGTEDKVILLPREHVFLFEGNMRTRALQEVLSGTLQVRLQIYNYFAVLADRLPGAIGIISGTGLAAPSGY